MKKLRNKSQNLIFVAIATLLVAIVIASCSVYAWFLVNQNNQVGEAGMDVVSSSNIDISVIITNPDGSTGSTLKFDEVVPGQEFQMRLSLNNLSDGDMPFGLFLSNLTTTVFHYNKNDKGEIIGKTPYTELSMLDVFAVSCTQLAALSGWTDTSGKPLYAKYATDIWFSTQYDATKQRVAMLDKFILPGKKSDFTKWGTWKADGLIKNDNPAYVTTVLTFKIVFKNEVRGADGKIVTSAKLGGVSKPVNINTFQNQQFKIGVLKLEDVL